MGPRRIAMLEMHGGLTKLLCALVLYNLRSFVGKIFRKSEKKIEQTMAKELSQRRLLAT